MPRESSCFSDTVQSTGNPGTKISCCSSIGYQRACCVPRRPVSASGLRELKINRRINADIHANLRIRQTLSLMPARNRSLCPYNQPAIDAKSALPQYFYRNARTDARVVTRNDGLTTKPIFPPRESPRVLLCRYCQAFVCRVRSTIARGLWRRWWRRWRGSHRSGASRRHVGQPNFPRVYGAKQRGNSCSSIDHLIDYGK